MQTLPILAAAQPATPAQTNAATDNNAAQPAESFGKVLERQRANADAQDQQQSSSSTTSASSTSPADDAADATQAAAPDIASTLPGDMLAALLPATTQIAGKGTDEKTASHKATAKVTAPDSAATLSGDMLAALAAAPAATPGALPDAAALQQAAASAARGNGAQQSDDLARALGKSAAPALAAGGQATELSRASDHALPAAASAPANTARTDTFSAMLGISKDAVNTTLAAGEAQLAAQAALPDAASALTNLPQGIATTPLAAAPNTPAQITLNTPVTQDTWGDEFNQKITWMATQHEQTAQLHLNPPQLGPLDVVLSVSGDQATALFTSPHAAVREALEQALPKLRDMLADNGITLGNAMVSDQSPREQQQAWQAEQGQRRDGHTGTSGDDLPVTGILSGNTVASARRHQGMVDTFA